MSERLLTLDFAVVALYLLVTLIVGIVKGRGVKTMEQFAIGDKERYGTTILVATLFASLMGGGSIVGLSEKVFTVGMVWVAVLCGTFFEQMFTAYVIGPHAGRFRGMISAGDMMESFYGKPAKIVSGLAGFAFCLGFLAIQIGSISYCFHYFFGASKLTGAILGSELVIIYSCFGGAKSVTYTDVIQCIVVLIFIPMLVLVGIHTVGGTDAFLEKIPKDKININEFFHIEHFYVFLIASVPYLVPPTMQRFLMARDSKQALDSFKVVAIFAPIFYFISGCIGLLAICLQSDLEPSQAFFKVVDTVLPIGWWRGMAIAGLLAAIMSTADSMLNAGSICLSHDVIKALAPSISDKKEIKLTQVITIFTGNISILVVLFSDNIYDIFIFSYSFWNPVIICPLIFGILGLTASTRSFLLAVSSSLFTMLFWRWIEPHAGFGGLLPSMLISAAVLLMARCFDPPEKRGCFENPFAGKSPLSPKKLIGRYLWTPGKHLQFSREQEQFYGIPFTNSVLAAAAIQFLPYLHITPKTPHFFWLLGLRVVALLLCTLIALRAYLPLAFVRRYLSAFWMLVLPYAVLVVPTFALFCNGGNQGYFAILCIGGLMLTLIVHPGVIVRMCGACVLLGWLPYRLMVGTHDLLSVATEIGPLFLLITWLGFLVAWKFSRSRETVMRGALASSQLRERVAGHESKRPLIHCRDAAMPLREDMEELVRLHKKYAAMDSEFKTKTQARYKMLQDAIQDIQEHSETGIAFLQELIDKVKNPLNTKPKCEIIKASECVALALAYGNFSAGVLGRLTVDIEKDFFIYGNKFFLPQLIINTVENAGYHTGPNDWIKLYLQAPGKYGAFGKICCSNSGKPIPTAQLPYVFDEDFSQRAGGTGTGTAFCNSIVKAIDGEAHAFSDFNKGTTTFEYWIPRVTQEMRKEAIKQQEKENKNQKLMQEAMRLAEERYQQRNDQDRQDMWKEKDELTEKEKRT